MTKPLADELVESFFEEAVFPMFQEKSFLGILTTEQKRKIIDALDTEIVETATDVTIKMLFFVIKVNKDTAELNLNLDVQKLIELNEAKSLTKN